VNSADPLRYFLIGAAFNTVRILALGVAIAAPVAGVPARSRPRVTG